jgi:PIN domain nuclease of toxin-antitoxin system
VADVVFDASAVLALLNGEPGADQAQAQLSSAVIGTVNLSEVLAKLLESGMPAQPAQQAVAQLQLRTIDFDKQLAHATAALRPLTRSIGLSFGDRACLALAQSLSCPAVTADRTWKSLRIGIKVVAIR